MAKIKQMKMRLGLNPDRPYQETVVAIYYDATDRHTEQWNRKIPEHRFYINLPQIVADALGVPDARGDDQAKALQNFEALIDKFKRLKTETNKVILSIGRRNPIRNALPSSSTGNSSLQRWQKGCSSIFTLTSYSSVSPGSNGVMRTLDLCR
ncbi:unnamed protein product [marine sediment metagenome]|uniref:Uncharacterized protein n=1 Tax=marine sediment metagenome TaxID=412755 RepID=X1RML2_9ZZZZ